MSKTAYIAIDLEMNQPSGKIIEIGYAIGSVNGTSWTSGGWLVDPGEDISPEITKLTGITNELIAENSTPLESIAKQFSETIKLYEPFVNPVVWGGGDHIALLNMFREGGVAFPHFGHRWIDVKTLHGYLQIAKGKSVTGGLRSCLGAYKMQFDGKQHTAVDDAKNTLRLFFHLVERQTKMEQLLKDAKEV